MRAVVRDSADQASEAIYSFVVGAATNPESENDNVFSALSSVDLVGAGAAGCSISVTSHFGHLIVVALLCALVAGRRKLRDER